MPSHLPSSRLKQYIYVLVSHLRRPRYVDENVQKHLPRLMLSSMHFWQLTVRSVIFSYRSLIISSLRSRIRSKVYEGMCLYSTGYIFQILIPHQIEMVHAIDGLLIHKTFYIAALTFLSQRNAFLSRYSRLRTSSSSLVREWLVIQGPYSKHFIHFTSPHELYYTTFTVRERGRPDAYLYFLQM